MRREILEASYKAGACHIGSALSCVEILKAIDKVMKPNDVFLFAKASGVAAYYCLLAEKGIIPKNKVSHYLARYPLASKDVPGVLHSVGSVGHGLNVACGLALVEPKRKVYCLISDGELNEGSTWEALMFAAHRRLRNLIVVIDNNRIQACGRTKDIINLEPLEDKFTAFNWDVRRTTGHYTPSLKSALTRSNYKSIIIIADTIKGKGVDFLEDKVESHYMNLDNQLLQKALRQV